MDRIVVGVDGSEASQRALAFALDDGRRRGNATIEVVHAWEPPVLVGGPVGTVPPVPVDGPYTESAHQLVTDALAAADTTGASPSCSASSWPASWRSPSRRGWR